MNQQRHILWVLGALLLFCLVYAHQKRFDSGSPVSRLDLLHALWEHQTFAIDAYHTNTPDKAVFQGHYYSDKAPGTVAVALPAFAASVPILHWAKIPLESPTGWLVSSWMACAGSLALITAIGGVALFAGLRGWVSSRAALITILAIYLGAAPLPYSTMMFSHALVIGLISIAIWAIGMCPPATTLDSQAHRSAVVRSASDDRNASSRITHHASRMDALAGFACGLALASEYSSGLIIVGLFLWLLTAGWRRALVFAGAASVPMLLIPAYSLACFGNPFILPYSLQASFPQMRQGVYAIQWPNPETAWNVLLSPTRGLLFWSPFLVIAGLGYWALAQKSMGLFCLTYLVPLLHVLVISGRSWDWQAGYVLGPRLLAPMLPLLALPCAMGVQRWPKLGIALAFYSIAITTLATLTEATPDYRYHNPLTELNLPLFLEGKFSPNLGMVLGLPPFLSVALYYAILLSGAGWLWQQGRDEDQDMSI